MRKWTIFLAVVLALLMLFIGAVGLHRLMIAAMNAASGSDAGEADPMFAPPPERVTRPPELTLRGTETPAGEDPSMNWHYETLTPLNPEGYGVE